MNELKKKPISKLMSKVQTEYNMKILIRFLFLTGLVTLIDLFKINYVLSNEQLADHEKAIKAVNEGEILPLDEILVKVNQEYAGRVISISLKDSEKGLFGWVYDIMIIEPGNMVKQIRVDAGTSTILSVVTGGVK